MFKKISIHLSKPICKCGPGPHIVWSVDASIPDKPGLKIWCDKCSMQIVISHEQFIASFRYEDGSEEKKSAEDLFRSGKLFHNDQSIIICKKN